MSDTNTQTLVRESVAFAHTAHVNVPADSPAQERSRRLELATDRMQRDGLDLDTLTDQACSFFEENPNLQILPADDARLPWRLQATTPAAPPLWFNATDDVISTFFRSPRVAILGARRATAYGREIAYSFARDLTELNIATVTSLALGVAGAAARGSLQGGGPTLAFLAGSPLAAYPRSHRLLYEQILENNVVASLLPPNIEALPVHFFRARAFMPLLAQCALVIEGNDAPKYTDQLAGAVATDLPIFAVPGPVTSTLSNVPNSLIQRGTARPILTSADLAQEVNTVPPDTSASPRIANILNHISARPATPSDLLHEFPDESASSIGQMLGKLTLDGRLHLTPTGQYTTTSS